MNAPYVRLGITLALGAAAMFVVLAAILGLPGEPGLMLGIACLAAMLVAPIGVLILLFMPHLFRSLRANLFLYAGFALIFLGGWAATHSAGMAGQQAALRDAAAERLARS